MHSIRKPRVFLSHSKKDVDFIRQLDADLRLAQCETWIDEVELRSGQPWMDQIFTGGIPSCEVVFCYLSENSIESQVFKQEMEVRLLEILNNKRVCLLLYTASESLRSRLRLDIQRLQIPEFTLSNYQQQLPRIVAEIWRFHAEATVASAIDHEKVKRLEAELQVKELELVASASIFSASEGAEFAAIWSQIDRDLEILASVGRKPQKLIGGLGVAQEGLDTLAEADELKEHNFLLKLGILFRRVVANQTFEPSVSQIEHQIQEAILSKLGLSASDYMVSAKLSIDLNGTLLRYGFLQRQYAPPPPSPVKHAFFLKRQGYKLMFTSKFDRFCFWLEHNFGTPNENTSLVCKKSDF